ncbi:mucin-2-like [Argiope bruennichi]|uniref:mucin-2-like n=1 Tax=Argiope bruennichi TaxID=94029 RepID=UPI0024949943|nr:mucin-2-like [Argiope bruennichi]
MSSPGRRSASEASTSSRDRVPTPPLTESSVVGSISISTSFASPYSPSSEPIDLTTASATTSISPTVRIPSLQAFEIPSSYSRESTSSAPLDLTIASKSTPTSPIAGTSSSLAFEIRSPRSRTSTSPAALDLRTTSKTTPVSPSARIPTSPAFQTASPCSSSFAALDLRTKSDATSLPSSARTPPSPSSKRTSSTSQPCTSPAKQRREEGYERLTSSRSMLSTRRDAISENLPFVYNRPPTREFTPSQSSLSALTQNLYSPISSASHSPTASPSNSSSGTLTASRSDSETLTASRSDSETLTASRSDSETLTASRSDSETLTASRASNSETLTASRSPIITDPISPADIAPVACSANASNSEILTTSRSPVTSDQFHFIGSSASNFETVTTQFLDIFTSFDVGKYYGFRLYG